MTSVPLYYVPKNMTKKDKKIIQSELLKSRKNYKNKIYFTRKKVKSFKSKPSKHLLNVKKHYNINTMKVNKELANKTSCSLKSLKKIVNKGRGAYYSSGSRPNQTAESWGLARLASSITGGPASKVDMHILKEGCKKNSKALKLAKKVKSIRKRKQLQLGGNSCIGARDGVYGCNTCCGLDASCLNECMKGPIMKGGYNMNGGYKMKEKIIKFEKAKNPSKKYTVYVQNKKTKKIRKLNFGARDYQQYRDSTPLGLYKSKNHGDFSRMQRYYSRHSGTKKRLEAIEREKKENKGYYTPKILSHEFLW